MWACFLLKFNLLLLILPDIYSDIDSFMTLVNALRYFSCKIEIFDEGFLDGSSDHSFQLMKLLLRKF